MIFFFWEIHVATINVSMLLKISTQTPPTTDNSILFGIFLAVYEWLKTSHDHDSHSQSKDSFLGARRARFA